VDWCHVVGSYVVLHGDSALALPSNVAIIATTTEACSQSCSVRNGGAAGAISSVVFVRGRCTQYISVSMR